MCLKIMLILKKNGPQSIICSRIRWRWVKIMKLKPLGSFALTTSEFQRCVPVQYCNYFFKKIFTISIL